MKSCWKFIIIALLCLTLLGVRSTDTEKTKLIIDTDGGIDDVIAILLILQVEKACPEKAFKTVAITTTYGNVYEDNVQLNVLKALTIANRSDVTVYSGSKKPLINSYSPSNYFGNDGLGDVNFTEEIVGKVNTSMHAAIALTELVKQYSGFIDILVLGPLTNVAVAIALDPDFLTNVKRLYILGSSVSGIGNVKPAVEFNFNLDPESNFKVLNSSTQTSTTLFPWETVLASSSTKDWRVNILGKLNSSIINFLNKIEEKILKKSDTWEVGDPMAAAALLYPQLITKSIRRNVSPVIAGGARGAVITDYTKISGKPSNVHIVQEFNRTAFQELLLKSFS